VETLHVVQNSINREKNEKDVFYNFLFAVQTFCETPTTKRKAGVSTFDEKLSLLG
jgi:hypothetical protein